MIKLKLPFKKGSSMKEFFTKLWNDARPFSDNSFTIYLVITNKRTFKQNSFYWFIVDQIAREEGDTKEVCHTKLKCLFLIVEEGKTRIRQPDEIRYIDWGKLPELAKDLPESKALPKKEFSEYWSKCITFGNHYFNLGLPANPNEMSEKEYLKYLEETEIN